MFDGDKTSAASWNSDQPLLTYIVPGSIKREVRAGQLVAIPYGERLVEGIIWQLTGERDEGEAAVLKLVTCGKSNSQIAQELVISEKTVINHLTHIFNKTNSENRAAATAFAIRHGLA